MRHCLPPTAGSLRSLLICYPVLPAPLPAVPAVVVVEEYDKLDCSMRGFFRQLLENAQVADVTANKCVGQHGDAGRCACLRHC